MKIGFARPDREHAALSGALQSAALRVLASGQSILGEEVTRFERSFAAFAGAEAAIGVSSGTDALVAALHALDVGEGDEVITGAFGFVAAPEAIVRAGARPVFVDVEPRHLGLDLDGVAAATSERTRAIIIVDLFGVVHDPLPLRRLAPRVPLVEDAAQALGSSLAGAAAGTLGDIGTFSFFPSKALGAVGDAGACVTGDLELAGRIRRAREHGAGGGYAWDRRGGNYRLDALQAALLSVKLDVLPARIARRREIGARLSAAARRAGAEPVTGGPLVSHAFAPLALRVPEGRRDRILSCLREGGIDARVHYPKTLPDCPPFARFARGRAFPASDLATRELLSVPCHPELSDEEVTIVEAGIVRALE